MVRSLVRSVPVLATLTLATCGRPHAPEEPAAAPVPAADIVLRGGTILAVDEAFGTHQAIAIREGRIVHAGSARGVADRIGEGTRVIELDGAFAMPGMVDAHCHPFALGGGDDDSDHFSVGGVKSLAELAARVEERVKQAQPGEWIIGGGWDNNLWPGKKLPVHGPVSAVSPDNPVFLYRHGGNSAFVNAKALEIAGITRDTPDPYGGKIARDAQGNPTGFLVNMGNNLVKKHFPEPEHPDAWYRERYRKAATRANALGLTGWHDAGNEPLHARIYAQMVDRGELTIRTNMMLQNPRLPPAETEAYFREHRVLNHGGSHMFQVRSVKMFFDGALGSRGAALLEPYLDDPDDPENRGVFEVPPEHVLAVARAGLKTGMQICPHAIGPRANREFLDAVEQALKDVPTDDHRFRSEHAEVVRPEDVTRFGELGVIASIQPIHCTSDMTFLPSRLGEARCMASASPWRNYLDAGVVLASGSDFMVEDPSPLAGIHAAVTRQSADGEPAGGWYPDQRMTREEAIRSYTNGPAHAAFLEDEVGSLEVGKLADVVVLDRDLMTVPVAEIPRAEVLYTIVNGRVVYERGVTEVP